MINTFTYRTEINGKEFQQTVYSENLDLSVRNWIIKLEEESFVFEKGLVKHLIELFESGKLELKTNNQLSFITYSINDKIYITYIDQHKIDLPDFTASLYFLKTEEGGRKNRVTSGYRPHFQIDEEKHLTSAQLLFIEKDNVFPGETVVAEIRIFMKDFFKEHLKMGKDFILSEGPNIIAKGKIIKVK
jgi:hypothetical protein